MTAAVADLLPRSARIGPNAIIQTIAVLRDRYGTLVASDLLLRATGRGLNDLPSRMVDEAEVRELVALCLERIGAARTRDVLREAGDRTACYLLDNRIPRVVQWLLRALPARPALRLLARAMAQHAWTFAGSGKFVFTAAATPTFAIRDCPLCRGLTLSTPGCDFYTGTFERLLDTLVRHGTRVTQVESAASGGCCCRYAVRLP